MSGNWNVGIGITWLIAMGEGCMCANPIIDLRAHLHCKPSRVEPDRTELNRAKRVTIHIASQADPNWKQCSWHFWTARMSNQLHVFSLMNNI